MPEFQISIGSNVRKSCYFDATVAEGVQEFCVYNHMFLPCHFGDPKGEYELLMTGVAMWDVAAQRQVELAGPDATRLAQYLTPRDIGGTAVGQGRYVPICDYDGFLLNDPVLLKLSEDRYWLSIADSDIALWARGIAREKGWTVNVFEPDVSPLAVQGPKAADVVADMFGDWIRDLRYFWFKETELDGIPLVLAKSGWSKQGGYEFYLQDGSRGEELWDRVKKAGAPYNIGPGAPSDVERIESGLISYGGDLRRQTIPATPFEMGMGNLVDLDKPGGFIGRDALKKEASDGPKRRRVGLVLNGEHAPRISHPTPVYSNKTKSGEAAGHITAAAWSRRYNRSLALGLATSDLNDGEHLYFTADNEEWAGTIASLPFTF